LYIYKKKVMKIEKKLIKESIGSNKIEPKTYSGKKQNIVLTESQLEKLLFAINKKWSIQNTYTIT